MTTKTIRRCYENGEGDEVIFYEGGIEIGRACTACIGDQPDAFLHGVEVEADYRNRGYGHAIVSYMIDTYGVNTLYVAITNSTAMRLYANFGFVVVGHFDADHVIMQR